MKIESKLEPDNQNCQVCLTHCRLFTWNKNQGSYIWATTTFIYICTCFILAVIKSHYYWAQCL